MNIADMLIYFGKYFLILLFIRKMGNGAILHKVNLCLYLYLLVNSKYWFHRLIYQKQKSKSNTWKTSFTPIYRDLLIHYLLMSNNTNLRRTLERRCAIRKDTTWLPDFLLLFIWVLYIIFHPSERMSLSSVTTLKRSGKFW